MKYNTIAWESTDIYFYCFEGGGGGGLTFCCIHQYATALHTEYVQPGCPLSNYTMHFK